MAPVVIPALVPTMDKSLKADGSLCLVRALRYYFDRTSDPRQHKELVSFTKSLSPSRKASTKISPLLLFGHGSSYDLSDQEALTLHQVKAHDVRAFAASKAF